MQKVTSPLAAPWVAGKGADPAICPEHPLDPRARPAVNAGAVARKGDGDRAIGRLAGEAKAPCGPTCGAPARASFGGGGGEQGRGGEQDRAFHDPFCLRRMAPS